MATPGVPPAYMGFVGFLQFKNAHHSQYDTVSDQIVRCTSADLTLRQDITKPDVIDSRYDRTVYQLAPQIVEGGVSFPAIYGVPANQGNVFAATYYYAVFREDETGLLEKFDLRVKYAASDVPNYSNFDYLQNVINTWQFRVEAEDVVNITMDLVGTERVQLARIPGDPINSVDPPSTTVLANSRIVTWNDAKVRLLTNATGNNRLQQNIESEYIRSFECNINNNVQRFYTLNGALIPQDIAPTKRDVTGQVVLMGRLDNLGQAAIDNQDYCYEDSQIQFGYESTI
ncbi:hypothetical protein LCGC14_2115740, partial [marine sediment metagenome]